jgi:hypothetical protein
MTIVDKKVFFLLLKPKNERKEELEKTRRYYKVLQP